MFNFKSVRYALLGSSLLLATLVGSPNTSSANEVAAAIKSDNSKSSFQNFCSRKKLRTANYFETNNFRVYICSNRHGHYFYNGISKRNGTAISLRAVTEEGTGYVAKNGQYEYVINGASLSIIRNGSLIREERVIRAN